MPDSTRKKLLDAALNTLLATADTAWWVKAPATFISELSARFGDLPDDEQAALAEATPEAIREALTQLDLATKHSAAGIDRIEKLLKQLIQRGEIVPRPARKRAAGERPPFMAEDLSADFVARPHESERLIEHLLHEDRQSPTAITAALRGAGGYGKTFLARAVCHDQRIRKAFGDGILWVTLGERPNVLAGVTTIYAALTGERPGFANNEDASVALAEALGDGSYLLVIDDVWNRGHLRPFTRGGWRCARLITTRDTATLPPTARKVDVDAMRRDESETLLLTGLPSDGPERKKLRVLADRLGNWALLLGLANAALRNRVDTANQTLEGAIDYVNKALDARGLTAFDATDPVQREQAVARTIRVSLDALSDPEQSRCEELAVFPEDVDIPLTVLGKLWGSTGGLNQFDTDELCGRFAGLSLLSHYDADAGFIRLHDVFRKYVLDKLGDRVPAMHRSLLDACRPGGRPAKAQAPAKAWANLLADEVYLWRYVAYHLSEAHQTADLRALLLDFDWLQAKLDATEANALISDFDLVTNDEVLTRLQGVIRLSAHVFAGNKRQLGEHLHGRLLHDESPQIQALLAQAGDRKEGLWLRPLTTSLTPPGGPLLRTLEGHSDWVSAVAVTPDGRRAVSGSNDNTLKVWDIESGSELHTLEGHSSRVNAVVVTADGRRAVSASEDLTLKVWDLESGAKLRTLEGHSRGITAAAVTPDGRRAVSASYDRTLKVWDLDSGSELRTLKGHGDCVNAVAVTPDGRRAVSASDDNTLKVWDLESGSKPRSIMGYADGIHAVTITADGRRAVSASRDWTLRVRDLESGAMLRTLDGHSSWVNAVALMPDGRRAVSASEDKTLRVWDLESESELRTLEGHSSGVNAVAVTGDGRRAVSASWDHTLKVWDLESGAKLRALEGHSDRVNAVAVTPDGRRAVSASRDETLKVWDLRSRAKLRTLEGHRAEVNAVAVTADGRRAVSASDDKTLKVWDLENGAELRTLEGHTGWIRAVAVTPDGRRAVSGSEDQTLKVWDLKSGAKQRTLEGQSNGVNAVAVTADGRRAVFASRDKTLRVRHLKSGSKLRTLGSHFRVVTAVAVTADGRRAVSASNDRTLKVWDLDSGSELRTLKGHGDCVNAVAVTPDGRRAVSASDDKTLKVWDLKSGSAIASFTGESEMLAVAVAPDGRTVVAGEESGRVHFLRLEGDEPHAENTTPSAPTA